MSHPAHGRTTAFITGIITAATLLVSPIATAAPSDRLPAPPRPTTGSQPPQGTPTNPHTWRRVPRANGDGWVVCRPRAVRCGS
ncbi:hypothetical protein AB0L82_09275 [Nocardia sp. NPDC052001]|uniref:hypothetical protein n=1 Tax=Nocardia sp. NPDC052001 TaxID=3154853 RepID=UPI00341F5685